MMSIAGLRAGLVLLLSASPALLALPTFANPSITAFPDSTGTAVTFDAASQTYTINGGTQVDVNLFHSFQQFGLSTSEIANFLANPDVTNILARVSGGQASVINGLLQVSGGNNTNLFILNPAGVLLGRNANLNLAGSFSVSTATGLAFGDNVFHATSSNDYSALTGNPTGYVFLDNEGVLLNEADLAVSPGESLTLAGSTVINTGSLEAPGGSVSIVAVPEEGILRISQDGLVMSLAVPTNQLQDLVDLGMTPLDLPSLLAGEWGGHATTVSTLADGTVVLSSGDAVNTDAGTTTFVGTVNVSGTQGGQVQVLGETVILAGATIEADGTEGGGNVWTGGDYLGQGDLPTAQFTQVDETTTISADAIQTGDGGRVIVWADQDTLFAGQISARGGAVSGDGGFVETSGAQRLTVANTAEVVTRATNGVWGTWLLDPADLTLGSTGTANIVGGTNGPTTATTIAANVVETALNTTDVTLQATNLITVNEEINSASGRNLTLQAPTANLNQRITLTGTLAGSGVNTVNVGANGSVQNGVDVAADGGTVNVAAGTFTEGQAIAINRAVTISGAGETSTVLDGSGTHQVLNNTSTSMLTLENLTVQNGSVTGDGGGFYSRGAVTLNNVTVSGNSASVRGGGFRSFSTVTLNDSTVSGNSAGIGGGGFFSSPGAVTLNRSRVSGNSASRIGGGFWNNGTLTINDSTIANNFADRNGGGFFGNTGTVTLNNSTVSSNSSNRSGGGFASNGATITVNNSTVSGNSSNGDGGGFFSNSATVTLDNATIAFNTADGNGGGFSIANTLVNAIRNSIIANNSDLGGEAPDISADLSVSTVINNLIQDTTGITGGAPANGVDGNIVGQDPLLAPLANNDGPTQTHGLLVGSPAINASGTGATTVDQRGVAAIGIRDIGAFEGIVDVNILDPDILFSRPNTLKIAEGPEGPILTIDREFAAELGILGMVNDDGTFRSIGIDGDIRDATPPPATQDQANDSDSSDDALCSTSSDVEGEPNNEGSCPMVIP